MAFRIPTRTVIRPGCVSELSRILGNYEAGLAVVVTDPGLSETDIPSRVCGFVETAGFRVLVFADVSPNPRVEEVDAMAAEARKSRAAVVIGVGGGSVLDAAKGVALMLSNPGSVLDYEGRNRFAHRAAPLVCIPTTCGTGSEVTWVSVLSDRASSRKISVKGDGLFPDWALVDADLLKTLPAHLVATTGLDAATHAVEAYIGRASNPATRALACEALRRILAHLEAAVADIDHNGESREAVMEASTLAGMAFGNADVGAVHCLSEAIGGLFDLPHGLLNARLLVPVLRFYGREVTASLEREAGLESLVDRLDSMVDRLGLPEVTSLGIPSESGGRIAELAEENGSNGSCPVPMGAPEYRRILTPLLEGSPRD